MSVAHRLEVLSPLRPGILGPRPTKNWERPSESLGDVGSESNVIAGPLLGDWSTLTAGELVVPLFSSVSREFLCLLL